MCGIRSADVHYSLIHPQEWLIAQTIHCSLRRAAANSENIIGSGGRIQKREIIRGAAPNEGTPLRLQALLWKTSSDFSFPSPYHGDNMLDNLKDPSSDFWDKSGRLSYLREETWGPCQWSAVWWDLQEIFIIRISRVSWVFKGLDRWERRWCKLYLAYPGWALGVGNWSQGAAVQERHLEIWC